MFQILRTLVTLSVLVCMVASSATAATLVTETTQRFVKNDVPGRLLPFTVTAAAAGEVTVAAGIRLSMPEGLNLTFGKEATVLTATGTAVTSGHLAAAPVVTYASDLRSVIIPVLSDWTAGEVATITGLTARVYDRGNSYRYLMLDLTADGVADATDINGIQVDDTTERTDATAPYEVSGLSAKQMEDSAVQLAWTNPPDLDLAQIDIERTRTRAGTTTTATFSVGANISTVARSEGYVDTDVLSGDELTYMVRTRDRRNLSTGVSVQLTVADVATGTMVCTLEYAPVCGADGVTYSNVCHATAAGTTVQSSGACPAGTSVDEAAVALAAKAVAAGVTVDELTAAVAQFPDLSTEHFAAGYLTRLVRDGAFAGYPDGTLQPDTTLNRAELAKLAARQFALPEGGTRTFTDVPTTSWFAPFVSSLAQAGAVWPDVTGQFRPAAPVSRAEAVWVLAQLAGADLTVAPTTAPFPDVPIRHRYAAAIAWAVEAGVASGYEDGTFGPADTLTRAQLAKLLVLAKIASE